MKRLAWLLLLGGCAGPVAVPVVVARPVPVAETPVPPNPITPVVNDYRAANHAALQYVVKPDADPDRIAHLTRLEADAKAALAKVQYDRRHGRPVAADLRAARHAAAALRDYARTSGN